ncbi:SH3 domain-containing protein [Streptococcus parasuis]|uniref:SH3 domain-containing protein n=1 Tax=Streptococcus parasuis TaxID=1501662 RepID=UPI0028AB8424|nr:SH3 domain-containing protein [Streptococcus parasuis]
MNNLFKKKRTIYQLVITACIIYFFIHSSFFASATTLGDNYPYTAINAVDPWRLYTRQCTSFSAFRLSTVNGFTLPPAYGDANVWGHRARQEGYQVDMIPAVGAVAWWESPMHVAWVSAVYGDTVEIEEYNYGYQYKYNRRTINRNSVSGYIHFKDLSSSALPKLPSTGVYTFSSRLPIKSQATQASTTVGYYENGEKVYYDKVIEAEGKFWISYISYSGVQRYIPVYSLSQSHQTSSLPQLPSSGTYRVKIRSSIRNAPKLSSPEITYYDAGATVHYDKLITADGRLWISYISYSGIRRYIAIS